MMKKLLLCASLVAMFGTSAEADLTVINKLPGYHSIRVEMLADKRPIAENWVQGGTPWVVDITSRRVPPQTKTIQIRVRNVTGVSPCELSITADQTLQQINTKTIEFAVPEEGGAPQCTVQYDQHPSSKPAKK